MTSGPLAFIYINIILDTFVSSVVKGAIYSKAVFGRRREGFL